MTTASEEAEQELAYTVGKDRARTLIAAVRVEAYNDAADTIEHWHGQAPEVYSPQDSAELLRHFAKGGNARTVVYPGTKEKARQDGRAEVLLDEVFNGPGEAPDDALTPPQRAARAIQDFHDPVVCGYIIGTESLQLILRPTEWRQWEIWRERLGVEPGSTETHAGGPLAARGRWGDTTVNINVYLDQLPQAAPEATGPDAPATPNSEA